MRSPFIYDPVLYALEAQNFIAPSPPSCCEITGEDFEADVLLTKDFFKHTA